MTTTETILDRQLEITPPHFAKPPIPLTEPDDDLRSGHIQTVISPRIARCMTWLFLAGIFSIPLLQGAAELLRGQRPQVLQLLKTKPTAENLHKFEDDLAKASFARRIVQPRLQLALSRLLAFGNSKVILARDGLRTSGWLYYELGNAYLSGPGFLDPVFLELREKQLREDGETNPAPDPRQAIIQFHRDCRLAGVHLVFVPIPAKPMLQPAELDKGLAFAGTIPTPNNPSYAQFIAELRHNGVDVFDPTPPLISSTDSPRYLQQDTHWTPEWMECVARDLADHVRKTLDLGPPRHPFTVRIEEAQVSRVGDIVDALQLPRGQTLFKPQTVTIRRILDDTTGQPLPFRDDADVVFFGDSFSNIFSWDWMGWGDSAGFPQHVSRFLGRHLDAIVENGGSATDVRAAFAQRPAPFHGKRLVIWQVAMHELACGQWEVIRIR